MNKLTALIEAAKVALVPDTDADMCRKGYVPNMLAYYKKADPATILELCTLLDKAEWTLEAMVENCEEPPEANCSCHVAPPCNDCVDFSYLREVFSDSKEALAAIKQWKEKT